MPIVVSQPVVQTPSGDAQSPDGRIRATVLTGSAGVFIRVDYTSLFGQAGYEWPNPFRLTIWKQTPDGVVSQVRGAANVSQYGGIFHAYDDEVTFGQVVVYWAEAPTKSGDEIVETDKVSVLTWEPHGGFTQPGVWIKNLEDPDLSVPARCLDWSSGSWASRNATADIWGGAAPAVTTDVRKSYNTKMTILTKDEDEYQALLQAVNASVVYIVGLERHRRRTGYYLIGDIAPTRVGQASSTYDAWDIALTGMERPKSAGHSLSVPGRSYADRKRSYATYKDVTDAESGTALNPNPSFEANTTGWATTNAALLRVNTQAKSGLWSGQITSTAGANPRAETDHAAVIPKRAYRALGWIYVPAASALTAIQMDLNWFDASHNYITTDANYLNAPAFDQWLLFDQKKPAPDGAAYASIAFTMAGTPGSGKIMFGDDLQLLPLRRYGAGTEPY